MSVVNAKFGGNAFAQSIAYVWCVILLFNLGHQRSKTRGKERDLRKMAYKKKFVYLCQ